MPILKIKRLEKATEPEMLRDDEEVFYCALTDEIFRDYEDFAEKMMLCTSMVWTCSLTGKSNLTYTEALESEEAAKKQLNEFSSGMKLPVLYLASLTKRSAFGDMAEDVFNYVKARYFIGETVETCFSGNVWKESKILNVITPAPQKNKKRASLDPSPDASLLSSYKYEVEHLDEHDQDVSEIMITDQSQIRRKKFSRERCKLFLKQHVQQNANGVFVVKASALEEYKADSIKFEDIFTGPPPVFNASKKLEKNAHGKKVRQESLHKFLTKTENNATNGTNTSLLERLRLREEEFKKIKEQKEQDKIVKKEQKKAEAVVIAQQLREWNKPREDLELPDQQVLPVTVPIQTRIPEKYFGDVLMVVEFSKSFSSILLTQDFFPGGLSIEIMERALLENEVAGPFVDLIQMLLLAIFRVQEEEAKQYRTVVDRANIKIDTTSKYHEAGRLATIASSWSMMQQGVPLSHLPLYSLTTSEILRLHLLSSGAKINNIGAWFRYSQRGGYVSEDDPGLHLRLTQPHIIKALGMHNVVQLPLGDKIQILSCLTNQLLSYADVRDAVEEQLEKNRQARVDYRAVQLAEKKREQELAAQIKAKKADKENANVEAQVQKLEADGEKRKMENEEKMEEHLEAAYEKQVLMGQDRAYRQYLKLESIPGLLVNFEEENPGVCLPDRIKREPDLVNADRDQIVAYLKQQNEPPAVANGNKVKAEVTETLSDRDLLVCNSDVASCVVHSRSANRTHPTWSFFNETAQLDQLVDSLNKRGVREKKLLENITSNRRHIVKCIQKTPAHKLNPDLAVEIDNGGNKKRSLSTRYKDANMGYPSDLPTEEVLQSSLIECILEMEEKVTVGNLGTLPIKDRERWRTAIQNRDYKNVDLESLKKYASAKNGSDSRASTPESGTSSDHKEYIDPGSLLTMDPGMILDDSHLDDGLLLTQSDDLTVAIQTLAAALAQIGNSVHKRYLKKPLGNMQFAKNEKRKSLMLPHWEQSLLASTSFSQVCLHYGTLESCIMWSKSSLVARCRICRRQNDSENMLLCDSCNMGHHLYCLKPKLKSVPSGDWFCTKCQKEKNEEEEKKVPPSPPKKRPIFRDEEIEDDDDDDDDKESDDDGLGSDCAEEMGEEEEEDDEDEKTVKVELCKTCGSGGEVITCEKCAVHYHIECVEPPLRRAPRAPWCCNPCKTGYQKRKQSSDGGVVLVQSTRSLNGQRRCAANALYKIHDVAKRLRQLCDSDTNSEKGSDNEDEEEVHFKRSCRRDEVRSDLPLHNAALHEVLTEVMKDNNAWPFLRPVQKNEVPDYYDVIEKAMDFGTIKNKLNMGDYREDAQFMADAVLIFQNCNTYNQTHDDVYKCGVQLLKVFQKKCRDLGLKLPQEMDYNDPSRPIKKSRTK